MSIIIKFILRVARRYNNCFLTDPYKTEMITIGTIYGTADAIVQNCFEKCEKYSEKSIKFSKTEPRKR